MTSSIFALIFVTQTAATLVPPAVAPRPAPTIVARATATILEARHIVFAEAPPPRRSRMTGELRRLVEFE